ncbi:MAG: FG-GAP-like repeat-containing protein, partial [Cytophagales bacterium]|nr:FG-GAP-like repeat-containing protein [Cytophagales bacterium]
MIFPLWVFPQVNFLPPVTYPTGYPYDLTTGDFNNDGKPDIAVIDYYKNYFDVYLNTGTGGNFAPKVSYGPTDGTVAYDIENGDFNKDGNLDIILSGYNNVVIFPGTGLGTFGTKTVITPPSTFNQNVAVGDFGNDTKLDFIISNALNSSVYVYAGNGNGTFTGPTTFTIAGKGAKLSMADINGDNRQDLIASNTFSSSVSVLTASGTGTFPVRLDFPTASSPDKAAIGDVTGDGKPDIVVPNSSFLCSFWNLGSGSFSGSNCLSAPSNCNAAVVIDYNLDGNMDVVTSNFSGSSLSFFEGTGSTSYLARQDLPSGNGQFKMVSADFNSDGKPDIATVNYITSVLGIYFNNTIKVTSATVAGTGGLSMITAAGGSLQMIANFSPANANVNTLVGWSVSPTSLAGINSSGLLSATSINNGTVTVTATFGSVVARRTIYIGGQQPIITNFAPQMVFPNQPIVINGSGFNSTPSLNTVWINKVPCQVTAASSNQLTIIPPKIGFAKSKITVLNESTRLLGTSLDYVTPLFFGSTNISTTDFGPAVTIGGGSLNSTATGDMDGDGVADIVSVATNVLNIQRNNGTLGSILGSSFTRTSIVLTYCVNSLELADMDMDGKLDILCSNSSNGNVHIIKNLSSPGTITASSFGALVTIPGNASNKLVAGDFNNDGKLDIISIEAGVGVIVFPNIGPVGTITSSSFGTPFIINSGVTSLDFKVEDLDRDGFLDIAVANGNNLNLIRNNGILNTLTVSNFSIAGSTLGDPGCFCDLELDDFDGDKKVDVLFGSQNTRFNFFQNNSSLGNLSTTSFLPKSTMTTSMAHYPSLLDLNGDSKTDLFQIDASADFIYGYQNLNSTGSLNGANFLQSFNRLEVLPNYVYYNFSNHDVDGDGRVDMVAQLNSSSNTIGLTIFQNLNTISYSPTSGSFGAFVSISGTNLASATGVSFNGSPASFTVLNPNMLVATVPSSAGSGPVRVFNTFYTATGSNFTFLQLNQSITG